MKKITKIQVIQIIWNHYAQNFIHWSNPYKITKESFEDHLSKVIKANGSNNMWEYSQKVFGIKLTKNEVMDKWSAIKKATQTLMNKSMQKSKDSITSLMNEVLMRMKRWDDIDKITKQLKRQYWEETAEQILVLLIDFMDKKKFAYSSSK